MRDRDALGPPGGAGGVEDVAERIGGGAALGLVERRVGLRGDLAARAVEHDDRKLGREAVGEALVRDRQQRVGIFQNIGEPVGGVVGVDRHIGRARLDEAEQRHIAIEAAVEQRRDTVAGIDAEFAEQTRHLVGARVEFRIGDVEPVERDGDLIRVTAAGVLDHVLEPLAIAPAQHVAVADDGGADLAATRGKADDDSASFSRASGLAGAIDTACSSSRRRSATIRTQKTARPSRSRAKPPKSSPVERQLILDSMGALSGGRLNAC